MTKWSLRQPGWSGHMAEEVFLSRPLLSAIGEARNRRKLPGAVQSFSCCTLSFNWSMVGIAIFFLWLLVQETFIEDMSSSSASICSSTESRLELNLKVPPFFRCPFSKRMCWPLCTVRGCRLQISEWDKFLKTTGIWLASGLKYLPSTQVQWPFGETFGRFLHHDKGKVVVTNKN